jgi:tetratricopeptide repeat protein 8
MQKALELAAYATGEAGFTDWWWKERLGKAYYQLGLLRDAEQQFASAAKNQVKLAFLLTAMHLLAVLGICRPVMLCTTAEKSPHYLICMAW